MRMPQSPHYLFVYMGPPSFRKHIGTAQEDIGAQAQKPSKKKIISWNIHSMADHKHWRRHITICIMMIQHTVVYKARELGLGFIYW